MNLTGKEINQCYIVRNKIDENSFSTLWNARAMFSAKEFIIRLFKEKNSIYELGVLAKFKSDILSFYKIKHPNVIGMIEMDEYQGFTFIVTEYVKGTNLKIFIDKTPDIDFQYIINVIVQIAKGLYVIHKNGLIHKNINPESIWLGFDEDMIEEVKIANFVFIDLKNYFDKEINNGKISNYEFMAPEVNGLTNNPIDLRCDQYSLGLIFYKMITGELPFKKSENGEVKDLKFSENDLINELTEKKLDKHTINLIVKLLKKDPADRYKDDGDVLSELKNIIKEKKLYIKAITNGKEYFGNNDIYKNSKGQSYTAGGNYFDTKSYFENMKLTQDNQKTFDTRDYFNGLINQHKEDRENAASGDYSKTYFNSYEKSFTVKDDDKKNYLMQKNANTISAETSQVHDYFKNLENEKKINKSIPENTRIDKLSNEISGNIENSPELANNETLINKSIPEITGNDQIINEISGNIENSPELDNNETSIKKSIPENIEIDKTSNEVSGNIENSKEFINNETSLNKSIQENIDINKIINNVSGKSGKETTNTNDYFKKFEEEKSKIIETKKTDNIFASKEKYLEQFTDIIPISNYNDLQNQNKNEINSNENTKSMSTFGFTEEYYNKLEDEKKDITNYQSLEAGKYEIARDFSTKTNYESGYNLDNSPYNSGVEKIYYAFDVNGIKLDYEDKREEITYYIQKYFNEWITPDKLDLFTPDDEIEEFENAETEEFNPEKIDFITEKTDDKNENTKEKNIKKIEISKPVTVKNKPGKNKKLQFKSKSLKRIEMIDFIKGKLPNLKKSKGNIFIIGETDEIEDININSYMSQELKEINAINLILTCSEKNNKLNFGLFIELLKLFYEKIYGKKNFEIYKNTLLNSFKPDYENYELQKLFFNDKVFLFEKLNEMESVKLNKFMKDFFENIVSNKAPLIMTFFNLENADKPSLKLLQEISKSIQKLPLFIIGFYNVEKVDKKSGFRKIFKIK